MNLQSSETKLNLMRAFAGESQARNRYAIAANEVKNKNLYVIEAVFKFTAEQEFAHAKVFYEHLNELAGESIKIDGGYPTDISDSAAQLLRYAEHNEYEEYETVYKSFAEKAKEEGFLQIASSFETIAEIEKVHGDRFGKFAKLLEEDKLFVSDCECEWICLNCGYVFSGKQAPFSCPVCKHDRGFFIRLEMCPYN